MHLTDTWKPRTNAYLSWTQCLPFVLPLYQIRFNPTTTGDYSRLLIVIHSHFFSLKKKGKKNFFFSRILFLLWKTIIIVVTSHFRSPFSVDINDEDVTVIQGKISNNEFWVTVIIITTTATFSNKCNSLINKLNALEKHKIWCSVKSY